MNRKTNWIIGILFLIMFWMFGYGQKSTLKFSHALHAENEVECTTCHQAVENSLSGADNLIPAMDVCSDCHDVEDESECKTCHVNQDDPGESIRILNYNRKFSHKKHLDNQLECKSCHTQLDTGISEDLVQFPHMTECVNCHQSKAASTECMTCHSKSDNLKPLSHISPDFKHQHGQFSTFSSKSNAMAAECQSCHKIDFCQKCHEGDNIDRTTHPLNFEFTHSFAARGKERECQTCHSQRNFCESCHAEHNVRPASHDNVGWISPVEGGLHKKEAEINLESCMACHENNAVSVCSRCHDQK